MMDARIGVTALVLGLSLILGAVLVLPDYSEVKECIPPIGLHGENGNGCLDFSKATESVTIEVEPNESGRYEVVFSG